MPRFTVVLRSPTADVKDEYFTPSNEIVSNDYAYAWGDFESANKAALRARIQDFATNRRIFVREH